MTRRTLLTGLISVGFLVLGGNFLTADDKKVDDKHAAHFEQCAKACTDCLRECESCAHHCAHLVAAGKKDHLRTLGTCADCADVCTAAAKVVARHGPLTSTICESCAKACAACAVECESLPIWSGCSRRASVPFPIRLTVVSCPATSSRKAIASSSSSLSCPPASSTWTSAPSKSSRGLARLTRMSLRM